MSNLGIDGKKLIDALRDSIEMYEAYLNDPAFHRVFEVLQQGIDEKELLKLFFTICDSRRRVMEELTKTLQMSTQPIYKP
jgi:hypothetical protein